MACLLIYFVNIFRDIVRKRGLVGTTGGFSLDHMPLKLISGCYEN